MRPRLRFFGIGGAVVASTCLIVVALGTGTSNHKPAGASNGASNQRVVCKTPAPIERDDATAGKVLGMFVKTALLRIHPECARTLVTRRWQRSGWPRGDGIPLVYVTSFAARMVYSERCGQPGLTRGPCLDILAASHPSKSSYSLSVGLVAPDALPQVFEVRLVLTREGWRVDYAQALTGRAGPAAS